MFHPERRANAHRAVAACLTAGLLVLVAPGNALAQPAPDPSAAPTDDELIAQGVELRKRGADADALAVFERAYEAHHIARALAQIALAHQALGHWVEAEQALTDALRDTDDPWIARQRAPLEGSVLAIQEHLASLEIETNVPDTEVWSDGRLLGRTPFDPPLRVVAGEMTLELRAPGRPALRRTLHIEAKTLAHETFTFVVEPPPEVQTARERVPVPPALGRSRSARITAGWISLAGAGGLVVLGAAGMVTREWEALLYNGPACDPTASESRYARCGTNRDIGSAAFDVGVGAFVGAGVLGIASGVLLLGGPPATTAPRAGGTIPRLACRSNGPGFLCVGEF